MSEIRKIFQKKTQRFFAHYTLQEHQNILNNATISRNSDLKMHWVNGKKYFLKHPAYFSKDIWEIYI